MKNSYLKYKSNQIYLSIIIISFLLGAACLPLIFSNINNLTQSILTGKLHYTKPYPLYGYLHHKPKSPDLNYITYAADCVFF